MIKIFIESRDVRLGCGLQTLSLNEFTRVVENKANSLNNSSVHFTFNSQGDIVNAVIVGETKDGTDERPI